MLRSLAKNSPRLCVIALLVVYMICSTSPVIWMVATAFKERSDITASPPKFVFSPTLANAKTSYNGQRLDRLLGNSLIASGGTVFLTLGLGFPAAYYFARYRTKRSRSVFRFMLSTRITPPIALSLPFFFLVCQLGLRGTHAAVILIHTVFNISFVVWLLEGFIKEIPIEIERAAMIDGHTRLGAVCFVLVPLCGPGLFVAALFTMIFSWNEYMMASLLSSSLTRPLTPALPGFIAQATTQWGPFCFVATVATIPVLLVAAICRGYLSSGLTAGAVKG